jgi:Bifunctional DNA primase/polymerase, N-terminal
VQTNQNTIAHLRALFGSNAVLLPCKKKVPRNPGWQNCTHADMCDAKYLQRLFQSPQIGLLCGDVSGRLIAIDIDDQKALAALLRAMPVNLQTLQVTGRHGAKLFFRVLDETSGGKSKLHRNGLVVGDYLANGSLAIVSGLHHQTNEPYTLNGATIAETGLEALRQVLHSVGISICRLTRGQRHVDADVDTDKVGIALREAHAPALVGLEVKQPTTLGTELKAEERLKRVDARLGRLYEKHVQRYFPAKSGGRNAFLVGAIPLLLRRVSADCVLKLVELHWDLYSELFNDSIEQHTQEAKHLISATLESYLLTLSESERGEYPKLSARHQDAVRICRSLASVRALDLEKVPCFFMSGDQMGNRLLLDCNAAFRVLHDLMRYGLLEMATKGTRRRAGVAGRATGWRWLGTLEPAVVSPNWRNI